MKTPLYEVTAGATAALLATRSFIYCDLYTITCVTGLVLRYATADLSVAWGGNTWTAAGALFDTGGSSAKAHWKVGLDTDTWQISVFPRPFDPVTGAAYPDTIGSQPWLSAARAGVLAGATVEIDRAYLPAWPTFSLNPAAPTGVICLFAGLVAEVDVARDGATLVINSHIERLGDPLPRNLYQACCPFTLFDSNCGLSAASFAVSGTLTGSSGGSLTGAFASPGGSGTYVLGRLQMTSGQNTGYWRMVKAWTSGTLTLMAPLPFPVANGDAYTLYPGCAKSMTTCTAFGNLARFGGQPFIPAPEAAV